MKLWLTVLGVALWSCGPSAELTRCGNARCIAGQRCDTASSLCVQDDPPLVTITPVTDVATTDLLTITGTVSDDVGVAHLTCGTDQNSTLVEATVTAGTFSCAVTLPVLDAQHVVVFVHATEKPFVADAMAQTTDASTMVLVDRVGPRVSLIAPLAAASGASAHVILGASDGSGEVATVTATASSQQLNFVREATGWGATVNLPPGLDAQPLVLSVTAKDAWGNATTTDVNVVVDTVGPRATVTMPAANQAVGRGAIAVRGTVSDGSAVAALTVDIADGTGAHAATLSGTSWSVDVPAQLTEDRVSHSITILATDSAGNAAMAFSSFRLDTVAPRIAGVTPANGTLVPGSEATVNVRVTAFDGVTNDGPLTVSVNGQPTTVVNGAFERAVAVPTTDYSAFQLNLVAVDEAGNQTTVPSSLTVDRVPPVVSISAPADNATFNIAALAPTQNSIAIVFSATDADPAAPVIEVSVDGAAFQSATSPFMLPTQASDNGKTYTVQVRARDTAGNTSAPSIVHVVVDRVSPTVVSLTPANNSRNVVDAPRIVFSEAVFGSTSSTPALTFSPALTGSPTGVWNGSHDTFDVTAALAPYSVSTATAQNLSDRAGNPVAPASTRFITAAMTPASGTTLATNVYSFTASADGDGVGVINVGEMGVPGQSWARRFDPATGALENATFYQHPHGMGLPVLQVTAWNFVQSDLTSRRNVAIHGLENNRISGQTNTPPVTVTRLAESAPAANFAANVAILSPAISPESGTAEIGFISGTTYIRTPGAGITLLTSSTVAPSHVALAPNRWSAQRIITGTPYNKLAIDDFACRADFFNPTVCGFSHQELDTDAVSTYQLSAAISGDSRCAGYAYDKGGQRQLTWWRLEELSTYGANQRPLPVTTAAAVGQRITAVQLPGFTGFVSVWQAGGNFVFGRATPVVDAKTCTVAFTPFGATLPTSNLSTTSPEYEIVQLGQKVALLYIDTAHALKVFVP